MVTEPSIFDLYVQNIRQWADMKRLAIRKIFGYNTPNEDILQFLLEDIYTQPIQETVVEAPTKLLLDPKFRNMLIEDGLSIADLPMNECGLDRMGRAYALMCIQQTSKNW